MSTDAIATLVRAVARLRERGVDDEALVDELARLIVASPAARMGAATRRRAADTGAADGGSLPEPGGTDPAQPGAVAVPAGRQADLPADEIPHSRRGTRTPAGRLVAEPSRLDTVLARADLAASVQAPPQPEPQRPGSAFDAGGPVAPLESLFALGRVRGILREMSTLTLASGGPDMAAIVRLIARAQPLDRLPRLKVSTLGHSVTWLFDAGPAMLPFARDKQQLAATALRLLGRDRTRIADFIGHPLQGVRAQRQLQWSELNWPTRGSAIVVVSDLGIGSRESALQAPAWEQFLAHGQRHRLRCVALVPYGRERWPDFAARFDTALTWDLATGVQGLRRLRRLAHGR